MVSYQHNAEKPFHCKRYLDFYEKNIIREYNKEKHSNSPCVPNSLYQFCGSILFWKFKMKPYIWIVKMIIYICKITPTFTKKHNIHDQRIQWEKHSNFPCVPNSLYPLCWSILFYFSYHKVWKMHFHIMRPYISIWLITPTLGGIFLLRAYKIWYKIYILPIWNKNIYI